MKKEMPMRICLCVVVLFFSVVVSMVDALAAPVPDTGQTKCYNATVEIPCPSPGEPFYGQDANYSINPMSYTKLDGSGNALADDAPSWVMVRDNVTGLIWEMKTDDGTIHDKDNTYTWYDSNPATNGGNAGTPGDGTDTEDFIKALNDAHFGSYIDWRLPTVKELAYIVKCSIPSPGPTIDTGYFPNTQASFYWSSTTYASYTDYAWGVDFGYGCDFNYTKGSSRYVRAVRGGQSGSLGNLAIGSFAAVDSGSMVDASTAAGGYTDNLDGTVTDTSTGLMWQQTGSSTAKTWEQALVYCGLNHGHYTGWRMPTKKELESLVDYSSQNPAINTTFFQGTVSSFYWSSTTLAGYTSFAWGVDFLNGVDGFYGGKYGGYYVRAVRGGQSRLLGHLIIISPNQADNWDIGSQRVITWNTPRSIAGNVKISISRDGGKNYTSIADAAPNNGSYTWTVAGPASVNCMIKIEPLSDLTKGTVQGLFTLSATPSFDIGLTGPGWNLISLPLQPSDTAISTVLGGISGKYASAWAFQNGTWKAFDPASPGFSDLSTLEAGWGYWLNMTQAATLSVMGTEPSKTINLIIGWNLIGYNSSVSRNITDALASITGNILSVWAYKNNAWQLYDPTNPGFSDLTTMEPGYGYWINTNGTCTWTLP